MVQDETRISALSWWRNMDDKNKEMIAKLYFGERHFKTLTGREIEKCYTQDFSAKLNKSMQAFDTALAKAAGNFSALIKSFASMAIIFKVQSELIGVNDLASFAIKEGINNKVDNHTIIQTLKDMIKDGYKGLSVPLSNEILNF